MSAFPEPLNDISSLHRQNSEQKNNVEIKINSLERKIMSLENTILKLIRKLDNTKKSRNGPLNQTRKNTTQKMIEKLKQGPYNAMKNKRKSMLR